MRTNLSTVLTTLLCAGLAISSASIAQAQDTPASPAAATQAADDKAKQLEAQAQEAIANAVAQAKAAAPAAIPVPDLPIVNKQELEGGLIIEDMKIGEGYEVKAGGTVVANYHGTLKSDGTVFDSSFQRGEPVSFGLNQVIQGWQKGVPGMKVGGIRKLTIPAALAYGDRPAGQIPPNSDLVFVIELVDALQVVDGTEGTGEVASGTGFAVTTYTIKDKDGKVIETADASKPYIWLPGEFAPMDGGVEGMKVGGTRTLKVPAAMNKVAPGAPSTRPQDVAVEIEFQLLAWRPWPPR